MTPNCSFEDFKQIYDTGAPQVLTTVLVSDLETPVSAFLKLADRRNNAFLLESVEGGEQLGRYSIIGFQPDTVWRVIEGQAEINRNALSADKDFVAEELEPLESLKSFLKESHIDLPEDAPPMAAGVFGYFGYDMIREIENLPESKKKRIDVPDAVFIRPTVIAIFDNVRQEIILNAPIRVEKGRSAREAYQGAISKLNETSKRLLAPLTLSNKCAFTQNAPADRSIKSNTNEDAFAAMVATAKEYIFAGDIFQVVLSQRFEAGFEPPPFELYRSLRRTNPSPFLFFLNFEGFALVGSSPEILVRVRNNEITIRPIAGTRPRGKSPSEDLALENELLSDPKECAEHLMLLDLGRNDVSRTAMIGTVKVTEKFKIERYSHVMHIVSNVVGQLAKSTDAVEAVMAGFPAGTVTGAPKIRAMEIIDELEISRRGPYGGAIGYFSASGDVDTCIALRTAIVKNKTVFVQAGAGIVADSVAELELEECKNKAEALFAAARDARARNRS